MSHAKINFIRKCSEFLLVALACVALETAAWTQSAPPPPGAEPGNFVYGGPAGDPGRGMAFSYMGLENGPGDKVVKGAPYSAQSTTETTQTLADGNRIYRKMTGQIYRDGEGRTRREHSLPAIGPLTAAAGAPQIVVIHDVVSGARYVLDPDQKIARVMKPGSAQMFRGIRGGRFAPPSGQAFPQPQIESLGKQTIGGVEAEGTRTTITIPAGQVGNDRPLVIVSERWYSPELKTVVMSKQTDPRMGETVFRLTNISRVEPAASLFAVPADYTIKEGHEGGRGRMMRQPPPPPDAAPPPGEES